MPVQIIPTGDDADYVQTTTLDGSSFTMRLVYNLRAACWYLDLSTSDGQMLAAGVKLVCNWDLLRKCANPARPAGKLFVLSATQDTSPPQLEDLVAGGRCQLIYWPAANLAALAAGASG